MTNFYYTDTNGQKQGLISEQHLRTLAAQGVITPDTPLETEGGHKGLAGQIPGLFDGIKPSFSLPVPHAAQSAVNLFCTNCGNAVSERANACMSCGASPIGHKKFCRYCGVALNPEQVICVKCGASLTGNSGASARGTFHNSTGLVRRFNTYFMVFWIFAVIEAVCSIFLAMAEVTGGIEEDSLLGLIIFPVAIPMIVFEFMLLYQLWKLIPLDIARTTPGKAVGFSFIPVFGFYWWFVAFWGLGKDMNMTLERLGSWKQVNTGLGLAACILSVVDLVFFWLPLVSALVGLAGAITLIFFFKSVKDGGIILLEQGGQ